ncbi:MAG TPA: alpha/beta hydrolase [Flavobacteriales bacterium]|nr:alpha/beta hydrolase [Flavobacteriales bacterium]HRP82767.1 alpha/beta hydrolase [Flavobacteriales bacterium]HRQ85471.1 alpha/beta hydrolase [Flavobacteriales bacterium]
MKRFLFPAACALVPFLLQAQECGTGRYLVPNYFPAIDSIPAVQFGTNTGVDGSPQALRMDIYAPANDPLEARPVVVLAFGGSFITGSRADVGPVCADLARMGYVAVAPDYRVGLFIPNTSTTMHAVQRCVHDLKGAIRFLRKSAAEGNPYNIDPNRIIVGGVSAGAIGALHLTYMNEPSELPPALVADSATLGGMEGTSGPLGYSSVPMACFSFSGALMDTSWVHPGDQPFAGIHETGDAVVPCYTQEAYALGFPTGIVVSGDHDISVRMDHIGLAHCYKEYPGNDHVGYLNYDPVNALAFMVQFMANVACGQPLACTNATGLEEVAATSTPLLPWPQPASSVVRVDLQAPATVRLLDGRGRKVLERAWPAGTATLEVDALAEGLYVLEVRDGRVRTARLMIAR